MYSTAITSCDMRRRRLECHESRRGANVQEQPGFRVLLDNNERDPETRYVYVFELSHLGQSLFETMSVVEALERRGITIVPLSPNDGFTRSDDENI